MMESERYREVLPSYLTMNLDVDEVEEATRRLYSDSVNHPSHYTSHPSGVECITITEHMSFNLGNALKYIWRADLKNQTPLEDLKKAQFYINREISKYDDK